MTEIEALENRHSVRQYQDRTLSREVVAALNIELERLNRLGSLNMQLVTDERRAFSGLLAYGKFSNVESYVMLIGPKSPALEYNAGYCGQQFVIYAQQLGLNTCWVGLTYRKVKERFILGPDEKILGCIAVGYGIDGGVSRKSKSPGQVSNVGPDTPAWFARGVRAALLAPTAVNQQKFRFEYVAPGAPGAKAGVRPRRIFSPVGYTKIDLGIAMRNFEIAAGTENFTWIDSPILLSTTR